jgi:hypothetical protein
VREYRRLDRTSSYADNLGSTVVGGRRYGVMTTGCVLGRSSPEKSTIVLA